MPKTKTKRNSLNFTHFFELIQKKLETTPLRDLAFFASWISGAYIIYETIDLGEQAVSWAHSVMFAPAKGGIPRPSEKGEPLKLNAELQIPLSLFLSYYLLTTDLAEKGINAIVDWSKVFTV
jgi:hypothetical protein